MLNIYICEDNDNERDYLSQLIKNIILIEDYDLNFACATADPYELLNIISTDNNTGISLILTLAKILTDFYWHKKSVNMIKGDL